MDTHILYKIGESVEQIISIFSFTGSASWKCVYQLYPIEEDDHVNHLEHCVKKNTSCEADSFVYTPIRENNTIVAVAVIDSTTKIHLSPFLTAELKTSLNTALGLIQLTNNSPELKLIDETSKKLLALVNSISQLDIPAASESVDLREVIDETVEQFQVTAEKKDITIRTMVYNNTLVLGDKEKLTRVVTNLLSNAIKYNVEDGLVTVSIDNGHVTFVDTGIGIDENTLKVLFDPFGVETGIGLYVSKRLIEEMGGKIGCSSVIDEGSSFWFSMPTI